MKQSDKKVSFDDPQNGGHFSCRKPVSHVGDLHSTSFLDYLMKVMVVKIPLNLDDMLIDQNRSVWGTVVFDFFADSFY